MRYFNFKSTYLFMVLSLFLMILTISVYLQFQNTRDMVQEDAFSSKISDVDGIAKNIGRYYINNLSTLGDDDLYKQFSLYLNSFETNNYSNIFVVKVDESKRLRVVADGTSNLNDKFDKNEIFMPISSSWKYSLKHKQATYFKQSIDGLWITYLYPVIQNNKVSLIIAVDVSIKNYNSLLLKQKAITKTFSSFIIIVLVGIIVLILFMYQYMQKKKDRQRDREDEKKYLFQEHKHAQIGRIIDSIAHQWIQPLQAIKTISEIYLLKLNSNIKITKDDTVDDISDIIAQTDFALETLDEFRTFLAENKEIESIAIGSVIDSSLSILDDVIVHNRIKIEIVGDKLLEVNIYPNEFKHVLINLIQNAKDVFIKNKIQNRSIILTIEKLDNNTVLKIIDNAGGIDKNILKNIFDLNISTKKSTTTTTNGMGLYMTKQILDKVGATIKVDNNTNNGATFEIQI